MGYITLLFNFCIKYYFHISILIVLFSCIFILFLLNKIKVKPTVKIENFYLAYFFVVLYILFYILLFLILRIYQIGKELDLKELYKRYLSLFMEYGESTLFIKIVLSLILIILISVWILIFLQIRRLLENQVWKVYFYYRNIWEIDPLLDLTKAWSPYLEIKFEKYLSFKIFSDKIYFFLIKRYKNYFIPSRELLYYKVPKIIKLIFFIMLLLFIILESYINNFILCYTFYYLIIYMLIMLWIKISLVIDEVVPYLDTILIERAYGEPDIIYVNLTEEEESLLELCVTNRKKAIEINITIECINWIFGLLHPITYRCRFIKTDPETVMRSGTILNLKYIKEGIMYYNKYSGLYFFEESLEIRNGKYYVNTEIQNPEDL